jgi:hypothetical protein
VSEVWPWLALFGLGAFHGINPGMGWLFAVALGLQEQRRSAVWNALPPIAIGHALSVGLVIALIAAIHASIPQQALRWSAAAVLIGFGIYRLIRARHPRWVGMRVGFRDLVLWSFLMESAHGAGLMLVPVLLGATHESSYVHAAHNGHAGHGAGLGLLNHPWLATPSSFIRSDSSWWPGSSRWSSMKNWASASCNVRGSISTSYGPLR